MQLTAQIVIEGLVQDVGHDCQVLFKICLFLGILIGGADHQGFATASAAFDDAMQPGGVGADRGGGRAAGRGLRHDCFLVSFRGLAGVLFALIFSFSFGLPDLFFGCYLRAFNSLLVRRRIGVIGVIS